MTQHSQHSQNQKRYTVAKEDAKLSSFVFGKLPPQSLQLEEAILGALMLDTNAIIVVDEILQPDMFYNVSHQIIYTAIRKLFNENLPIDLLTTVDKLKKEGQLELVVGGAHYLLELTNRVTSSANIEYHSRIVLQQYLKRQIIAFCSENIRSCYEETTDAFEALENTALGIQKIEGSVGYNISNPSTSQDLLETIIGAKCIERLTGISSLDNALGIIEGTGAFIVVTAAPGVGKSVLQNTMFIQGFINDIKQAHFSLETQLLQMELKAIIGLIGGELQNEAVPTDPMSYERLRRGVSVVNGKRFLSDEDVFKCVELQKQIHTGVCKLQFINGMTLQQLVTMVKRLAREGVQLITLDRAELFQIEKDPATYAQLFISLRGLAAKLGIKIVLFAQQTHRGGDEIAFSKEARNSAHVFIVIEPNEEQIDYPKFSKPIIFKVIKNSMGAVNDIDDVYFWGDRQIFWGCEPPPSFIGYKPPSNGQDDNDYLFLENSENPF